MRPFFFDTSALAKRYLVEAGSDRVKVLIQNTTEHLVIISELTLVEMFSLLARRQKENDIQPKAAAILREAFLSHVHFEYVVVAVNSRLLADSRDLVTKHPGIRTLDAIQVTSAVYARDVFQQPVTFVSSDIRPLQIAADEGFITLDPNRER